MFINKDLLDFFGSMAEIKKQKRDVFNALAADVDDPEIRETLLQIGLNQQQQIDQLSQSIDLVNGRPSFTLTPPAPSSVPSDLSLSSEVETIEDNELPVALVSQPDVEETETFRQLEETSIEADGGRSTASLQEKTTSKDEEIPQESEPESQLSLIQHSQGLSLQIDHGYSNTLQPTPSQTLYSMNNFKHPLAEVFGFTTTDPSAKAQRYRSHRQCPFNNRVPNCTKGHPKNPLGVCSLLHQDKPVITCPVRFREEWLITDDAASFFFEEGVRWSSLTEVELKDAYGRSAGDIDVVLIAYDQHGKMVDFGAIEVQTAFISGDARDPFDFYMKDPLGNSLMDWSAQSNYPQPDYVSAQRESLVPQLIFKGSILHSWHKKMAVAINRSYFETLPNLVPVQKEEAEIAWFIYDLELVVNGEKESYELRRGDVVYTKYQQTLSALTASYPDNIDHFMKLLPELADK